MTGRRSGLPRPTRTTEWAIEAIDSRAAEDWEKLCAVEPNAAAFAWDRLSTNPEAHSERQTRLKGSLATGTYEGRTYVRWQYEVTSGGRIWYFVDDPTEGGRKRVERRGRGPRPRRRVLVEAVHVGHPKATE
ncbi:MAG: hypothetical protein HY775_07140 [Acidobacteria bacterium]|nr:hypothetical protein [Acidobacteriota bacterium]